MNPAFLDNMSWEMAEVYGAITDQILINLARHFPFYNAGDPLPKSAFEYQAAMLAQMGQVNKETVRIIRNGLADADDALQRVLEQAIIDSVRKAEPELLKAVKAGILHPPGMPIVAPNQMRAFQLYYTQAADKLNLVNTVMLESTMSAYSQAVSGVVADIEVFDRINRTQIALDTAAGETITGVSSWNQALRHATDRMKDGGIVGFIDHGGHRWSAEAYTAMDIRTTVFNTGRAAVWETNQNFGNDLYIVSYHNGARPLCYDWQNKVISANNNAGVTYDLDGNEIRVYAQSETTYGEPAGLFGINCQHYPNPWIPGVSLADGKPQDKEENDRVYKESQEQRRLERKLREEKRDLQMAKAQGRPQDEIDRLRDKCKKSSEDIDTFCKETGRARHRDREAVYTKREFPDKERYDVSKFEHDQKDRIEQFYKSGGAQRDYTFGQMAQNEPEDSLESLDRKIEELQAKKREFIREHRFDLDDGWRSQVSEYNKKIDELTGKAVEKEKAQKSAEKEARERIEKEERRKKEAEVREKAIAEYNKRIEEIERKRFDLIASGSDDHATSDKLFAEIERLEGKKRIVEKGGWTLDQATKTQTSFTVNPNSDSTIVLDKADVYTMPDGKQFVFKSGMNKAHQAMTPEELIDAYYEMPPKVRENSQNIIAVVDRYNPADSYWRKTYKDFTHSYMTGGEQITLYRYDGVHDKNYLRFSLDHEAGHFVDRANQINGVIASESQEWAEAMEKDKLVSGLDSMRSYGKNSKKEDFADSVAYYITEHDDFVKKMPHRAQLLDKILGLGGAMP